MDSVIELKGVSKKYNNKVVLDRIDLCIQKGTIVGLIGENGAGKTTLMKSILGLIHIDDGEIFIANNSLKREYSDAVKNIGFLLEPTFYNYLSSFGNMKVNMLLNGYIKKDYVEADHLLKFVGLYDVKNKKASTFSFGMKQRLGLAQALIGSPDILLLDEPMVGMDPIGMKNLKEKIQELHKQGKTILFSSHQLESVQDICTDIAVIKDHKILLHKRLEEVVCNIFTFEFEKDLGESEINSIKIIEDQIEILGNKIVIKSDKDELFSIIALAINDNKIINYSKNKEDLNKFFT